MTKLTEIGAYRELGGSILAYIAVAKEQTLYLLFVQWIQLIQLNESSKIINSRNFQIAYCTWTLGKGRHTVSLRLFALGAVHKLRRLGRERGDLGSLKMIYYINPTLKKTTSADFETTLRLVNFKSKLSSHEFFQKTNE